MLEIESGVMAYGFYQQIKYNKQQGITNLKKFMKSNIPKDKAPDFTEYGLTNEVLLELSQQLVPEITIENQMREQEGLEQGQVKIKKLEKTSSHSRAFISSSFLVVFISFISVALATILIMIGK